DLVRAAREGDGQFVHDGVHLVYAAAVQHGGQRGQATLDVGTARRPVQWDGVTLAHRRARRVPAVESDEGIAEGRGQFDPSRRILRYRNVVADPHLDPSGEVP